MEPLPHKSVAAVKSAVNLDVVTLLRLKNQIKQQLTEFSTAVRANHKNYPDGVTDGEVFTTHVTSAIQDLEKGMEEVKGSFQNKALALQRIQITSALREKVKQNEDDSGLTDTMKQIAMLSNAIIEGEQQACEKKQKLLDIKRKRLSLQKSGQQMLQEIRTVMEKQASKEVNEMLKLHEKLRREKDIIILIQNIFQNIIIGSRINWAEDPSLKETLLQLEKYVSFL